MDPIQEEKLLLTRRLFFGRMATGVGAAALGSLLNPGLFAALAGEAEKSKGPLGAPHFAPKARRVIYLFMAGGPSQMELFDYKPTLEKFHETELPDSIRMGQRITTMTSGQKSLPVVKSIYKFSQHGKSGAWPGAQTAAPQALLSICPSHRSARGKGRDSTANPARRHRRRWPCGQKNAGASAEVCVLESGSCQVSSKVKVQS